MKPPEEDGSGKLADDVQHALDQQAMVIEHLESLLEMARSYQVLSGHIEMDRPPVEVAPIYATTTDFLNFVPGPEINVTLRLRFHTGKEG